MFGTLSGIEALPAAVDDFANTSAEQGDRNLSLRHEGCEQLRPPALVAIKAPGLDQLGAGVFVVRIHVTLVPSCGFPPNHHSRMTTDGATSSPPPLGGRGGATHRAGRPRRLTEQALFSQVARQNIRTD